MDFPVNKYFWESPSKIVNIGWTVIGEIGSFATDFGLGFDHLEDWTDPDRYSPI